MVSAVCVLSFWAVFFGALEVLRARGRKESVVKKRLRRLGQRRVFEEEEDDDLLTPDLNDPSTKSILKQLSRAGLRRKRDVRNALRFQRVCYLIPFICVIFLFFMGIATKHLIFTGVALLMIFIIIPRFWYLRLAMKRKYEIERAMPETLDLLTLCIEAGLSFDAAMVRVAEEQRRVSAHMSRELILTNQEILAGKTRDDALGSLAERTGVEDMQNIVSAVLQSIKLGTSLAKTLRTQASVMRKHKHEFIRAAILKTPVKLIFPLLLFIFPNLLIVILGPSLTSIFRQLSMVNGN